MPQIHPTALIDSQSELGADVQIGPNALIQGPVQLGNGCRVEAMAVLKGPLEAGENCHFGHHCVVGEDPQDRSFDPATPSGVRLGANNTLREFVSIHRGSKEDAWTSMGDNNFLMGGAHLAHDVSLGSENNLANNVLLAGFVQVGDRCFLGGGAVVHQFVRLGSGCLLQGVAGASMDVAPFSIVAGVNQLAGLNAIGLKRAGYPPAQRSELRRVWKQLLKTQEPLPKLIAQLRQEKLSELSLELIDFCAQPSRQGILRRARRSS